MLETFANVWQFTRSLSCKRKHAPRAVRTERRSVDPEHHVVRVDVRPVLVLEKIAGARYLADYMCSTSHESLAIRGVCCNCTFWLKKVVISLKRKCTFCLKSDPMSAKKYVDYFFYLRNRRSLMINPFLGRKYGAALQHGHFLYMYFELSK